MKKEITTDDLIYLNNIASHFATALNNIGVPCVDAKHVSVSTAKMAKPGYLADTEIKNKMAFIRINEQFILAKDNNFMLFETICHELIHTCPGAFEHNEVFRKYALKVEKNLGYETMNFPDGFKYAHLPVVFKTECSCGLSKVYRNPKALELKAVKEMMNGISYMCPECGKVVAWQKVSN